MQLMKHLHTTDQLHFVLLKITVSGITDKITDFPAFQGHIYNRLINSDVPRCHLRKILCLPVNQVARRSARMPVHVADIIYIKSERYIGKPGINNRNVINIIWFALQRIANVGDNL